MSTEFHWGLHGLDLSKFMALANCLLMRNSGQVDQHTTIERTGSKVMRLKRRFLDRFSELASRERHNVMEVTAAILRESDDVIEIWVAKNGGLDAHDLQFSGDFERFMADSSALNSSEDTFWEFILRQYQGRLESYLTELKSLISLIGANAVSARERLRKYTNRSPSSLSINELSSLVDVANLFISEDKTETKAFNCIAKIARTRRFHKTFLKFARRYPSIKIVTTGKLSMTVPYTVRQWTLSDTFRHLGILKQGRQLSLELIRLHLGSTPMTLAEKNEQFNRYQQPGILHCHAEILLIREILKSKLGLEDFFPYIGCSKRSCYLCHAFLTAFGFPSRGCHMRIYTLWTIPPLSVPSTDVRDRIVRAILEVQTEMSDRLKLPLFTRHGYTQQSTVGSELSPTVASTIMPSFNEIHIDTPRQSAHTLVPEQIPSGEFNIPPPVSPSRHGESSYRASTPKATMRSFDMHGSVKDADTISLDEAGSTKPSTIKQPSWHNPSNASGRSTPRPLIVVDGDFGMVSLPSSVHSIVLPVIESRSNHPPSPSRSISSSHRRIIPNLAQRDSIAIPVPSGRRSLSSSTSSVSSSSSSTSSYRTIRNGAYHNARTSPASRFTENFEDPFVRNREIVYDTPNGGLKSHFSSDEILDGPEEIIIKDITPSSILANIATAEERIDSSIASERGRSDKGDRAAILSPESEVVESTHLEPFSDSLRDTSGRNRELLTSGRDSRQDNTTPTRPSTAQSSLSISTDSVVDIRIDPSSVSSLISNSNLSRSKLSSAPLSSWQSLENTLLRWTALWSDDTLQKALAHDMCNVNEVALTIWSIQTYKRYLRNQSASQEQLRDGGIEVLFIPPNIAEVVESAMSNYLIDDAQTILRAWASDVMQMREFPRRVLVLVLCRFSQPKAGKEKGYEWKEWVVHEVDLTTKFLTSYGTSLEPQLLSHATVKNWRRLTTSIAPPSISPGGRSPRVTSNIVRINPPDLDGYTPSLVIPAVWYNLLTHKSRGTHLDTERVHHLIRKDVKSLLVRKRLGHLIDHA